MTIHLYFLDTKFQLLGIFRSLFYLEETAPFFWFTTQLGPFWGAWGNNSSKHRQIMLKF